MKNSRRDFVKNTIALSASISVFSGAALSLSAQKEGRDEIRKTPLGFDNFSIRTTQWKAGKLLDWAASQKVDCVLFSDLEVYESLEESYFRDLQKKADDLGLFIYVGGLSVCPSSRMFSDKYGTAEEFLRLMIKIAGYLKSPVVRCVLGSREDRQAKGGIWTPIRDMVDVLKRVRSQALDAGVKIAVENHAGDMQAWELERLVEMAGKDFVSVTIDPGNAVWALEDPMTNLEILSPYVQATGIRDSAVWETDRGMCCQWTAMGEGYTGIKEYIKRFQTLCPEVPCILEIISGFNYDMPYLEEEHLKLWPELRGPGLARLLRIAKSCKPKKAADNAWTPEYQIPQLEASIRYCRDVLGLGTKK